MCRWLCEWCATVCVDKEQERELCELLTDTQCTVVQAIRRETSFNDSPPSGVPGLPLPLDGPFSGGPAALLPLVLAVSGGVSGGVADGGAGGLRGPGVPSSRRTCTCVYTCVWFK